MTVSNVMLADKYRGDDPTGWWISEKLDGVRALWNGFEFVSRKGNKFSVPIGFSNGLPAIPLDGELWMGRGLFRPCVGIVRSCRLLLAEWSQIRFCVFDAPDRREVFEDRQEFLGRLQLPNLCMVVSHIQCAGFDHLDSEFSSVIDDGGEGLILRRPGSEYEFCRSSAMQKMKMTVSECRLRHRVSDGAML